MLQCVGTDHTIHWKVFALILGLLCDDAVLYSMPMCTSPPPPPPTPPPLPPEGLVLLPHPPSPPLWVKRPPESGAQVNYTPSWLAKLCDVMSLTLSVCGPPRQALLLSCANVPTGLPWMHCISQRVTTDYQTQNWSCKFGMESHRF